MMVDFVDIQWHNIHQSRIRMIVDVSRLISVPGRRRSFRRDRQNARPTAVESKDRHQSEFWATQKPITEIRTPLDPASTVLSEWCWSVPYRYLRYPFNHWQLFCAVVKPHQGHYNGFTQKAFMCLVDTPYSTATGPTVGIENTTHWYTAYWS